MVNIIILVMYLIIFIIDLLVIHSIIKINKKLDEKEQKQNENK